MDLKQSAQLSETETPPHVRTGFGYMAGALVAFLSLVGAASMVAMAFSSPGAFRVRVGGVLLISGGASFVFIALYIIITKRGFTWSLFDSGAVVVDQHNHPVGFWIIAISILLIFSAVTGAGIFLVVSPVAASLTMEHVGS